MSEMARIGTYQNLDFRIYPEPLLNPSFHLVHKDFEIVLQIKDLKILEIKYAGKKYGFVKDNILSGSVHKQVIAFMKQKAKGLEVTNKRFTVVQWNLNNDNQIDDNFIEW